MNQYARYTIHSKTTKMVYLDGKEQPVKLFSFVIDNEEFYFECRCRFEKNGNDFRVLIRNFGIRETSLAGSTTPTVQKSFNKIEANNIKLAIENYFLTTPPNNIPPFSMKNAKCIGVEFQDYWIVTEYEACKSNN